MHKEDSGNFNFHCWCYLNESTVAIPLKDFMKVNTGERRCICFHL